MLLNLLVIALAFCAAPSLSVQGQIYRCETADGAVLFSDLPCPGDARESNSVSTPLAPLQGAELLSAEERNRALQMDARWRRENQRRSRVAGRRESALITARRRREVACESARAGLARLRAQRRGGYLLSEDRALSREEAELVGRIRDSCASG
jgi:hypothetical protein